MRIEIINNEKELEREYWEFDTIENRNKIVLSQYGIQTRTSKRHKWRFHIRDKYNRYDNRYNSINVEDITIPEEVKKKIKDKFIKHILKNYEVKV